MGAQKKPYLPDGWPDDKSEWPSRPAGLEFRVNGVKTGSFSSGPPQRIGVAVHEERESYAPGVTVIAKFFGEELTGNFMVVVNVPHPDLAHHRWVEGVRISD